MKNLNRRFLTIAVVSVLTLCITSEICSAQEIKREGKYEFYGVFLGRDKVKKKIPNTNYKISLDGGPTGGIGFGYNFYENLNLNAVFAAGPAETELETLSNTLIAEYDTKIFLFDLNLDYALLKDPFTPIVTGGVGAISVDDSIKKALAIDDMSLSWNIGGGLRWDVSDKWFLKIVYKRTWTEFKDTEIDEKSDLDSLSLSLAYKF